MTNMRRYHGLFCFRPKEHIAALRRRPFWVPMSSSFSRRRMASISGRCYRDLDGDDAVSCYPSRTLDWTGRWAEVTFVLGGPP